MESFWKWYVIPENFIFFAKAFGLTLELFIITFFGCWIYAIVFGAMRHSELWWLRLPSAAIIETIRGTPGLMFLVWVYFLSKPLVGFSFSPFWAAVWGLILYDGSYAAEVIRAGLDSVPKSQIAAGYSTGLNYIKVMRYIVLPQVLRNMAPAIVNRTVALFKGTSSAYIIGLVEFFRAGILVNGREYASFSVFTFVAAVYFVCCFFLSRLGNRLGRYPTSIKFSAAFKNSDAV